MPRRVAKCRLKSPHRTGFSLLRGSGFCKMFPLNSIPSMALWSKCAEFPGEFGRKVGIKILRNHQTFRAQPQFNSVEAFSEVQTAWKETAQPGLFSRTHADSRTSHFERNISKIVMTCRSLVDRLYTKMAI